MASTKVRGITIELNADTSGISKGLKSVNSEIKSTQSQLKDVDRLLKLDPTNTQLLEQKQRLLKDAVGETSTKLETLKKAQEEVGKTLKETGEGQEQYDALTREIVSCEKELENLEKKARESNATLQKVAAVGDSMKEVGGKISGAGEKLLPLSAGIAGIGAAAVKTTAEFDSSMSKVAAVSGAAGDEFDALRAKAREMGETTKFTASDAAEAMNYMAMAGWKTEDMLSGIDGIMNLAAASGEELGTTSDIVTDALTAFGLSAKDSGHFADILAAASSNANTNVSMLGESFKYAAPVAGSLGYSAEDVSVALGLMANSGIKASQAGTTLRNIFTRMAKPTKESQAAMDRLGLSLSDGEGNMLSFREIMDQLRGSFGQINMPIDEFNANMLELDQALEDGDITEKKYNDSMAELIQQAYGAEGAEKARTAAMLAGQRGMSGLLAIVNASEEDYNKLTSAVDNSSQAFVKTEKGIMPLNEAMEQGLEIMEEYDGSAKAMAATMQDNAAGQFEILKSQVQELAISFGDLLMPTIKSVITWMQKLMDKLNGMDDDTKKMIVTVAAVVAAIGPLLIVIGKVISSIGTILSVLPTLSGAISSLWSLMLANPIAVLIAAITALVLLIATKGDEIQAILREVDNFIQGVFSRDFTEVFGPVLGEYINAFVANIRNMWNAIKQVLDGLIDFIRGVFTGDWDRAWTGIMEIFGGIFDGLEALAKAPLNGVIGLLNGAINGINDLIEGFNNLGFELPDWLGGGSWYPDLPTIGHIPYLAKGGILSQGSAVVGEAGAELLTMSGGRAIVQPLTNNTANYAGATNNFYIQSTDPEQVAEEVATLLNNQVQRQRQSWA